MDLMLRRFDRYMLAQLLMLFGFFALVLVLIYWINRAVVLFDQLIANGESAVVFLEFTALSLPNVVRLVLPVAAFAASLYVTNRLMSESELVVVQATGHSPARLVRPVLIFGCIVFVMSSVLAHVLVPASQARLSERSAEISENMTTRLLREGQFLHPAAGVTFYIREVSRIGALQDVFLFDARNPDRPVAYSAKEALLIRGERAPSLVMIDGMVQSYGVGSKRLSVTRFDDFAFDLSDLVENSVLTQPSPRELPTSALIEAGEEIQAITGEARSTLVAEAHDRFSDALNGLVAPLFGFAVLMVGGFSRFGVWRQSFSAVIGLILIQMITQVGQGTVRTDADNWPLAYSGPLVGLIATFGLLFIAARPGLLARSRQSAQ